MNIFYLGHFGYYGGLGKAARDYVDLLIEKGHEVHCKTIDNFDKIFDFGQQWVDRCSHPTMGVDYDLFIVHKTPHNEDIQLFPEFKQAKQHIYMTIFETDRWPDNWRPLLGSFEKIITNSSWQVEAAINMLGDSWKQRIYLVPHVVELPLFPNSAPQRADGFYTFYSEFSQIIHRKGLDILLKAYFSAFSEEDKVRLVLKIPPHEKETMEFTRLLVEAERSFKWKKLPRVEICQAWLSDKQMQQLMEQADCYVCSARGEGFSIPLAKAAVMGKQVLYPYNEEMNWGIDYCDLVDGYEASIKDVITDTFADVGMALDTTKMQWLEPSIKDLANKMKEQLTRPNSTFSQEKACSLLNKEAVYAKLMEAIHG